MKVQTYASPKAKGVQANTQADTIVPHLFLSRHTRSIQPMNKEFKLYFDEPKNFEIKNIKPLIGLTGLYFIFTTQTKIQYPFMQSRLLYIGMSEKKTNSIGTRLIGHFEGKSRNQGLVNYRKVEQLNFAILNFEMLRSFWNFKIEDLESYFILDFVEKFGVYPICNNKSGFEILKQKLEANFIIDWKYFD